MTALTVFTLVVTLATLALTLYTLHVNRKTRALLQEVERLRVIRRLNELSDREKMMRPPESIDPLERLH